MEGGNDDDTRKSARRLDCHFPVLGSGDSSLLEHSKGWKWPQMNCSLQKLLSGYVGHLSSFYMFF